jgi:hypothetical protein
MLILILPFEIPQLDVLTILTMYGEIEDFEHEISNSGESMY